MVLRALVDQLWLPTKDLDRWPVRISSGTVPAGHRVLERYAVVPGPQNPRFLVPLDSRAVAAGSLSHYNGLRWARLRAPRTILSAGFRTGVAPALLRHRLLVCVSDRLPADEYGDYLLSAHLKQVLDLPTVALGIGVRAPDPNQKPTLQIFGPDGVPVGYAKIGWNAATRELTEREATALTAVTQDSAQGALRGARVPRLLHQGRWRDYQVTVTAPLPLKIRRYRETQDPPPPPYDPSSARTMKLIDSAFWRALRAEVAVLAADDDEQHLAAVVTACCERLESAAGEEVLRFSRWHGDWVPWNMGRYAGELHVWDWEHSAPEVPLGFDLLHWRFQIPLVLHGRPMAESVAAVRAAAEGLTLVAAEHRTLLGTLYLLEMFMRTYHLKRLGGGWNPAIHPAMLPVLEEL